MPETKTDRERLGPDENVEIVPASSVVNLPQQLAPTGQLDALSALDNVLEVLKRQADGLVQVREAALNMTDPMDWVAMKGKHDSEEDATCLLRASGATKINKFYRVGLTRVWPTDQQGTLKPEEVKGEGGEILITVYAEAYIGLTGETILGLQASRASSEKFIGRGGLDTTSPLVARADLIQSCVTLLMTKAVRAAGFKSVPVRELEKVWKGQKKISSIPRGSGFGTSTERGASAVTTDDVKSARKKLGDEVLARVGGAVDDARKLLKDITSNPPKFDGFDTVERLTQDWQISNAWDKLRSHPVFGDQQPKKNGGSS